MSDTVRFEMNLSMFFLFTRALPPELSTFRCKLLIGGLATPSYTPFVDVNLLAHVLVTSRVDAKLVFNASELSSPFVGMVRCCEVRNRESNDVLPSILILGTIRCS